MSSLQDRIDCRLATTVLPQAPTGMPKGWEWLAPPPPSKKRLLPWSDIAVLATLGVADLRRRSYSTAQALAPFDVKSGARTARIRYGNRG